jgi:hypothetical protein
MARLNARIEPMNKNFISSYLYTGDVDLNVKLVEWERFYNLVRSYGAFKGKARYESRA